MFANRLFLHALRSAAQIYIVTVDRHHFTLKVIALLEKASIEHFPLETCENALMNSTFRTGDLLQKSSTKRDCIIETPSELQPLANKNRQRKKNDSTNYLLCFAKFAVIWYKIGKHMLLLLLLFYVFLVLFQFVSKCGCYVCPMFPMFYFDQTQRKPNFFNIMLQPHHLYMGVLEGVFTGVPCWAEGLNTYYIYMDM